MAFGETYLCEPDLFPARQSGETWGDERVVIRFAGNEYDCLGLSAVQASGLREKFGTLCPATSESSLPRVPIRVFRAAREDFVDPEGAWDFDFDLDYGPESIAVAGCRVMARLDWKPGLHAALWTSEDGDLVERSILENVFRIVVAYHLLDQGGVLLHSAALADARGAQVFFGPSGAGKSTISRLGVEAGRAVLSDDMNALRLTPDGVLVDKVPFAGEFGQSIVTAGGSHRVSGLSRLEKAADPEITPLQPSAGIAALLASAPFVNRNPHRCDRLVETLSAIQVEVPVRVLRFARDQRFWALLEQ